MLAKLFRWLTSFKGALIMAIIGLFNVAVAASTGSATLWLDVAFVCFWVYIAWRAVNGPVRPLDDISQVELTKDQEERIRAAGVSVNEAIAAATRVAKEIELEVRQAQRDKKREQEK